MIGEGKTRGQCAILNIHAAHNQNTAALRAKKELLDFRFLYNFLVYTYEDTRRIGSGNNQKALNKARVSALTLPPPTIEEQIQIVQEIESRLSVCDNIEQTISEALLKSDPARLKLALSTLNMILNNEIITYILKMDDNTFVTLLSWMRNGIPMGISQATKDHTYIYLKKETLTPFINIIDILLKTNLDEVVALFGKMTP
jgi:hypothetical protein